MKKTFLTILIFFIAILATAQEITLVFSAKDATTQNVVELSSVLIENLTLGCDTIVPGPNPTLVLPVTFGVNENNPGGNATFRIISNMPNPFTGSAFITICMPESDDLLLVLSDAAGHILARYKNGMGTGSHKFEIISDCPGLLLLNAFNKSEVISAKLINSPTGYGTNSINYTGRFSDFENNQLKNSSVIMDDPFRYYPGDQLKYTSTADGYYNNVILDSPVADTSYTFQMSVILTLPSVYTFGFPSPTPTTAVGGGSVTSDGGSPVTAKGVCWSIFEYPTLADNHTLDGIGTGEFTSNITGLTPLTLYYVRAYATNILGTAYGDQVFFTTAEQNEQVFKLAGETSKNWKLIRVVSTGRYPIEVGPYDHSSIWWAMGLGNNELFNRACMLNDEWTFYPDGTMEFNANGDYWAEGGVFDPANFCASTGDPMISVYGEDLSAWGNGVHQFELSAGSQPKLSAIGTGAYIGFFKVGNDYEVYDLTPMVQSRIDYKLIKLYDAEAGTDTLIVEMDYYDKPGDVNYLGYWRHVLVHYDDPADEPPIPTPNPSADFSYVKVGLTVTFTNNSTYADSYLWNFGDGATSTETNPVHTYAAEGQYTVTLTAYNVNGQNSISKNIVLSAAILTEDILASGPWKLQVTNHACYVGPGMGDDGWWITPLSFLDGSMIGTTDDWSCMTDDEFIFSAGGGYEYKTHGGSRNDGYMGSPNGCWTDDEIAASPGAPFGSCNTHTFTFTPADGSSRAVIELTNGPGFAAFIGFMKGYYGGENANGANPPNGGNPTNRYEVIAYSNNGIKEILIVSVDITADHSGTAAWTMELERPASGLTEEILTAGPWKLQVTDHTIYIGPAMGSDGWWITPLNFLDGGMIGTTDDWSCMTDDEFIFSAGGGYEYKTHGGSRNDGYMGTPNGCWTDDEIAASPGAPFGSCNTHTFEFTPAIGSSRPIITLTNGPGFAAFIGFMKGYYGGENTNGANPPNGGNSTNRYEVISYQDLGTREVLIVTVDITSDHSGTAAWTMELER